VRSLVQSGELRYIQIGGRQQYRVEAVELENYIQRMYARVEGKERGSEGQGDRQGDRQDEDSQLGGAVQSQPRRGLGRP
jgi:hypothetical protein